METERLLLRRWHRRALQPFARINNDPRVMEFFPSRLSPTGSDAFAARIEAHFQAHGFGLWALELRQEREFIGFAGLAVPALEAHFTPCVEIGWRLDPDYWGCGLATEAARAAVDYAFHSLNLAELVSFTVPANVRSRRVMEKIGMTRDPAEDFNHPSVPAGHPLRLHVLYRLKRR